MSFDLFADEHAAMAHTSALLGHQEASAEELRQGLASLLKGYDKLFKGAQRIMRMSDRSEQKLKQANILINQQQSDLVLAHEKLEHHAEILEETVRIRTADLVRTQEKLRKLVELGVTLASENHIDALFPRIVFGGKALTSADAGTLYLRTKDDHLNFVLLHTDSLGIARGGTGELPVTLPAIPLRNPDGTPDLQKIAARAVHTGKTVIIDEVYDSQEGDFSCVRQFDQEFGYRSHSVLAVPLKLRQGRVIGVLQLINATDPTTGGIIPFDPEVVTFVEALAAQAGMTMDNQLLIQSQKELFDAFIRLIAAAIDAKSPYTGGHCERVPELARMLAVAVCASDHEGFADFKMSDEELQELRIASWLHDCGKVTTPEYVVDKATKLEGIYNRIHEVRMRFEVLHRDARIACLQGILADQTVRDRLEAEMEAHQALLQEEFAFVAHCNVGGEFMSEAAKERLRQIAQRTWKRHFDDRLGLSQAELKRRDPVEERGPLPVEERLLADKKEHVIPRDRQTTQQDAALGIQMPIPKHLYNLGEIYNLCIDRGTLTPEERYKINEHVVQTLVMLESLPFPDTLARVPEYAGAHHETMLGTGYPRRLKREAMSVPARILAIADVFEALTATDRPYKETKTLSQAIRIMSFMKKDGHIDPDLFMVFLKSRVYLEYAEKFLERSQIDPVDIAQYL